MNNKGFISTIIAIILVLIIISIAWFSTGYFLDKEMNKFLVQKIELNTYQYDLVQISNTKDINGNITTSIFYGYGYVNEKPYYYMYIKKDDEIQLLKQEAENNSLYSIGIFQDSNTPYIKSNCYIISKHNAKQDIEIHIPPGSMVQNIDINSDNFK